MVKTQRYRAITRKRKVGTNRINQVSCAVHKLLPMRIQTIIGYNVAMRLVAEVGMKLKSLASLLL